MKVWLDDTRRAPPGWTLATTVDQAVALLSAGDVSELSLDYDLDATDGGRKGIEVLDWVEDGLDRGRPVPVVHVHSANAYGSAAMSWRINRMERRHGRQQPFDEPRTRNVVPDRFNRVPGGLPDGDVDLAKRLLGGGALLLDVRTPREYASGHLEGALNVPHDRVAEFVPVLDRLTGGDREWAVVVYCVWGRRGADAKVDLMRLGFPNVLNVGGLDGLLGRPLVRDAESTSLARSTL